MRVLLFAIVLPADRLRGRCVPHPRPSSFIYGTVLTILGGIIGFSDEDSFSARTVNQVIRDDLEPVRSDVPGVLMIQIDGLALPLLRAQVRAGNLPTLSRPGSVRAAIG